MAFIDPTSPPVPTRIGEVPPLVGGRMLLNNPKQDPVPDVIATPLFAFVDRDGIWQNFDRRAMNLSVYGEWNLLLGTTIGRNTPITQQITEEQGIVNTDEQERSFAATIGVNLGLPNLNLGAMISSTLTSVTRQTVQTSSKTTISTTFNATTELPQSTIWYWQLRLSYEVDGVLVTFEPRGNDAIQQIRDGEAVETNDGPGRQRRGGGAVPVRRFPGQGFTQQLMVADQIFRTTQFPPSSALVQTTNAAGTKSKVLEFDSAAKRGDLAA